MSIPVLLPNVALTFRNSSHTGTERLLVRLRSLPEGWRVAPVTSEGQYIGYQDVTIYGPRVSETDLSLLVKLGRCVRYMEFKDDAPF